jgi:pimeloyl-ACP methyl ester carboxylesterase
VKPVKTTFLRPGPGMPGMLYEPVETGDKSSICVVAIHCEADYLDHTIGPGLAKRGYRVLCANTHSEEADFPEKIKDVANAVEFVRTMPEVKKIVLMGHSGGATLMSAYQAIAENGVGFFRKDSQVIACPDYLDGIPCADGFLSMDSNWGNGTMRLFSTDPAIIDERSGMVIDPELDMFSEKNGWSPEGATYTDSFLKKFFMAQHERNERLIRYALERNAVIDAGKGFYADDEPFTIPAASLLGHNNKLFPQDRRFLSRTAGERTLVHNGGHVTTEVVHTVRTAKNLISHAPSYYRGAMKTSIKRFLNSWCVKTDKTYHYDDRECFGIIWDSSYCCAPGNVTGVTVPSLVMGMTANWEFSAVETIYNNLAAEDKECAFIEGADHNFHTDKACERYEGEFGDTVETTYDYVDGWLSKPGRFI